MKPCAQGTLARFVQGKRAARRDPAPSDGLPRAILPLGLLLASTLALPCPAAALVSGSPARSHAVVTLISRSAGLELPVKEEGHTELELGDVNGDGQLDVVSVGDHGNPGFNSDEHGIMVWLGNGAGTWSVHQFGNFGYGGCALGDLDRDGHLDVAWGIHHNYGSGMGSRLISAARGDGTGASWTDWGAGLATNGESWGMFATALADWNEDGLLDILSESFGGDNGLQLYRNRGDGTWSPAWAMPGGTVEYTVESCDFNADGHADIICTRSGTNALLGDGAFGFTVATAGLPAGTLWCVDAGDMDGDGRDDVVFGLGSSGLRVYRYDPGLAAWQNASSGLPASGTFSMCQFGDINGDGNLDVVGYAAPNGSVWLGDGAGHWTADATWTMPSPGDPSALRVDGDIDHDGREDILVQATQSGFPFYRNQLRAYSPWAPPGELAARVVTPRGGETMRIGSIRDLRWLAAVPGSLGPARVELRLSLSGPDGPWTVLASDLPDNGRYEWRVDAGEPSAHCRIEVVVSASQQIVTAVSPADFNILLPEGTGLPEPAPGSAMRVLLSPNPVCGAGFVQLLRPRAGRCDVDLLDAAGRLIRSYGGVSGEAVRLRLLDAGGRGLPRGVYFLRVAEKGAGGPIGLRLVKE